MNVLNMFEYVDIWENWDPGPKWDPRETLAEL